MLENERDNSMNTTVPFKGRGLPTGIFTWAKGVQGENGPEFEIEIVRGVICDDGEVEGSDPEFGSFKLNEAELPGLITRLQEALETAKAYRPIIDDPGPGPVLTLQNQRHDVLDGRWRTR
jgi:hypothetical protein